MIRPTPSSIADIETPVRTIVEGWQYRPSSAADAEAWRPIEVPGEPAMQGFDVVQDQPASYRVAVEVQPAPPGYRHFLRFTSVYSRARVLIDGVPAGEHDGGFTSWELDVTRFADARRVEILLEVVDRSDDLSWASGYAKHPIGGILGPVEWIVLPPAHLTRLVVETRVYGDSADVRVESALTGNVDRLEAVLLTPDGAELTPVADSDAAGTIRMIVDEPMLWDAEHPVLYRLRLSVWQGGRIVETVESAVGIREVRRSGNKLLVNGRPVHLRGVNRHNIHPRLGRTSTPALDRQDARLFKAANVNFVRTSHYPPHPAFLEAADELGIYVEVEAPACFMGTHGNALHQFDESRTGEFTDQVAEMVDRDRNHPSVILWSLGNESVWGPGYAEELSTMRSLDTSRPVIFSYPDWVSSDGWQRQRHHIRTDILSVHYAGWQEHEPEPLGRSDIPVLHDEYAHVPCYDVEELVSDPAVRLAWGEGFIRAADQLRRTDGALGCAIWAAIDEVFELPGVTVGYGQWGIIDVHRRTKPEYAFVARAFSPIEVLPEAVHVDDDGLVVPIVNWFDHADFSEVSVRWEWIGAEKGESRGESRLPRTPPRGTAELRLPLPTESSTADLSLRFEFAGRAVDEYLLDGVLEGAAAHLALPLDGWSLAGGTADGHHAPEVTERPGHFEIETGVATIAIARGSGLIDAITVGGEALLRSAPVLWLNPPMGLGVWRPSRPRHGISLDDIRTTERGLEISVDGMHGELGVRYTTVIGSGGCLAIEAVLLSDPPYIPRTVTEPGIGFREAGLLWLLAHARSLSWRRRGTWLPRDGDDLGRLEGEIRLDAHPETTEGSLAVGGQRPWAEELAEPIPALTPDEQPALSRDVRAARHGVQSARASCAAGTVEIVATGNQSVRIANHDDTSTSLVVATAWGYPEMSWGNHPSRAVHPRAGWGSVVQAVVS